MFDDDLIAFLESGCSTIVGLATDAGAPFATRGWGTLVLDGEPLRLRLLVGAGPLASLGRHVGDAGSFPLAMTGADVLTLRSVQVKGTAHDLEAADADDEARCRCFCDDFFGAVRTVDGTDRELMERLVPADLVAVTLDVEHVYDQTPGPGAGALLSTTRS